MTPANSVTEQQHRTSITITEPGGQMLTLPVATETSFLNPVTGERALVVEQHRYRTADGRSVNPEEIAHCCACQQSIAPAATSFCEHCQVLLCKNCAQQPPRCKACRKKERRKNLLRWLTSL